MVLPQYPVSLFPDETTASVQSAAVARPRMEKPAECWLCLYLWRLPLEPFSAGLPDMPVAVAEGKGKLETISACNAQAADHGICPGSTVAAAIALLPKLKILTRRIRSERELIERLADWAGQFTPRVSLAASDALLLEVRGSLRLFGGMNPLLDRIRAGLDALGYEYRIGAAPTPLAALWCSRADPPVIVAGAEELPGKIARLALKNLDFPAKTLSALGGIGVRCVGDYMRLPRADLARRFGRKPILELQKALGELPDVRPNWKSRSCFQVFVELPFSITGAPQLMPWLQRSMFELQGFLRRQEGGIESLLINLRHSDSAVTALAIELLHPCREAAHFVQILRLRLERLQISSPISGFEVRSGHISMLTIRSAEFFEAQSGGGENIQELRERLQARLGSDRVLTLSAVADYRPEAAWRAGTVSPANSVLATAERPVWLVETPYPLGESVPFFGGKLRFVSGPERIEAGWWDGSDVARDYYVARNDREILLWIFRDRRTRCWFLHGFYG